MATYPSEDFHDRNLAWVLMAGFGLLGAIVGRLSSDEQPSQRHAGPPEYAPLVPTVQARQEAKWTKEAKKSK
ncbi:MAG TPA: hypothetical protein VFA18_00170 [Gemmataceae bacterium]|nr:hypothetical protein [Gemmataceae bacterium]